MIGKVPNFPNAGKLFSRRRTGLRSKKFDLKKEKTHYDTAAQADRKQM
jgi:hypothetical protein